MKLKDNKNIFCTVSAGYSSIMMALKLKEWYPDHTILYAMANTSKEDIKSLDFMHKCDEYFDLGVNWIQAIFNPKRGDGVKLGYFIDRSFVKISDIIDKKIIEKIPVKEYLPF